MKVEVPPYDIEDHVTLTPARTVLLVVDMQRDFIHPEGALPPPDPEAARETVRAIRELTEQAREAGTPVWFTRDTHREGDPEWEIWGRHVEEGSWGWEFVDELQPAEGDRIFRKSRYDGFYGTELDHSLRVEGRDSLIICGTVANICVHYTAASAGLRFLDVVHPVEGIQALTEFDLHAALRQASWLFQATLVHADGIGYR